MSLDNLLTGKLQTIEARYEDLNTQLADPAVVADTKRYQKTAKTHSELGEIVSRYREFKDVERGIRETQSMIRESHADPEMTAMAEEELSALEQRQAQCEKDLRVLLLPKDPNDQRNVILEIRA